MKGIGAARGTRMAVPSVGLDGNRSCGATVELDMPLSRSSQPTRATTRQGRVTARPARAMIVGFALFALVAAACGSSGPSATSTTVGPGGPSYDPAGNGVVRVAGVKRAATTSADARRGAPIVQATGAELYGPLAAALDPKGDGNFVFSPASLAIALAMLRAGASGASATQIDRFLHVGAGTDLSSAMNGLDTSLSRLAGNEPNSAGKLGPVAVWSANSLWGQLGVTWQKPFLTTLAQQFGTGLRVVDYRHDADGARLAINRWVSDQTRKKIPDLIPPGALDDTSVLTLVNALYFKAPWFTAFTAVSGAKPFHRVDGSTVNAPMMTLSDSIAHAHGPGWTAVRIPYAGQKLAMTIIVPDAGSFATVRDEMSGGLLARVEAAPFVTSSDSTLTMPKFDLTSKAPLSGLLKTLGVTAPWSASHDFDSMSHQLAGTIYVNEIRQQATITVDEKGTEAAAATSVEMKTSMAAADPFVLDVDRPFLFTVGDVATGTPLFLGQVTDPTVKG